MTRIITVAAVALFAVGCGSEATPPGKALPKAESDLKDIFDLYTSTMKATGKPPAKLADLNLKSAEALHPSAAAGLASGEYVCVFGVKAENAKAVLAYEKAAPTAGGYVLMSDGTVKTVTAAEFAALKK